MKIKKILKKFLGLHPREIDLSLDRIKRLNHELGNPQNKLKIISITGTNGKNSIALFIRSILEEAGYTCDLYSSPHVISITERFVFSGKEISDDKLCDLLEEVEKINKGQSITFFEFLTSCFFLKASRSRSDISIVESGLFNRFDACSAIKQNLMSVISSIGLDHLEWLPENDRNVDRVIFEKTSKLLHSKIIVSEQSDQIILDKIEKAIASNSSKKILFSKDFSYSIKKNGFVFQDVFGKIELPYPNLLGAHQVANASCGIAAVRNLEDYPVNIDHIKKGITKIKSSIARLQIIEKGKLKELAPTNTLIVDGTHNPLGAEVTRKYLDTLDKNKNIYMILGMMNNKLHKDFLSHFKNKVFSITAIDIPNQQNAIKKEELNKVIKEVGIQSSMANSIEEAIIEINKKDNLAYIFCTGSLYSAGEILKLN